MKVRETRATSILLYSVCVFTKHGGLLDRESKFKFIVVFWTSVDVVCLDFPSSVILYTILVGRGQVLYRSLNQYYLVHHRNWRFIGDPKGKGKKEASHAPGCMEFIMSFITKALFRTIYLKSAMGYSLFSPTNCTIIYILSTSPR